MLRLYGCPHSKDVVFSECDVVGEGEACHSCDCRNVNGWRCLAGGCGFVGCGHRGQDHSGAHFQSTRHPIAINIHNRKVYCNTCQRQLRSAPAAANNNDDSGSGKQAAPPPNGYTRASSAPSVYAVPDDRNYEERPLGLVGLKNLGNTCYMNAALQCLLNIPQMTEFFETTHPSFFDNKHFTLTRHYQHLVNEVFDYRSKACVIPTGVCHTMKAIYPPFRGYLQQDAQEFLRVFMDKVHGETRAVSRRGAAATQLSIEAEPEAVSGEGEGEGRRRRRVSHSIISDIFQGTLSNSIRCLQCERISNNEDSFEDLSLPIASSARPPDSGRQWWPWQSRGAAGPAHLARHGAVAASRAPASAATSLLLYQLSWLLAVLAGLKGWFSSSTVSLEQCLDLFFSQDELKGDNKYSCDRCKGHQNAIMQSKLLQSPEILCFHLKRFRNDFGFSKITTSVRFPIDGLDMSPYLHPGHSDHVHLYDLIGVICHYGSGGGGGGHYTAYTLSWRSQSWFEFDDDQVTEVDVNVVMGLSSCAYVLFYKKRDDDMIQIREHADRLLKTTVADSVFKYYMNRSWVVRFNTFAEPGAINNYEFLCGHGAVQPERAALIRETTIEVSQKTWAYLLGRFGGGPTCTSLHVCAICDQQRNLLLRRREAENATFTQLHRLFEAAQPKRDIHVLSLSWFRRWEDFTKGVEDDPPGPIDNNDVVYLHPSPPTAAGARYCLNTNSDYGWVSRETWAFFHGLYGGGPLFCTCPSPPAVATVPPADLGGEGPTTAGGDGGGGTP